MKATVLFLLAVITSAASAQVYRCPDPQTGKTTYSDSPCTQGKQIDRPRTLEERMLDEERAAVARESTMAPHSALIGDPKIHLGADP